MRKPNTSKSDDQRARFLEAARKAEVDESGKKFERAMRKIVPRSRKKR